MYLKKKKKNWDHKKIKNNATCAWEIYRKMYRFSLGKFSLLGQEKKVIQVLHLSIYKATGQFNLHKLFNCKINDTYCEINYLFGNCVKS